MNREPAPVIAIIVAVARNGVIGRDNALPWHLPADLRHFKTVTMGRPVIMGRRTHESIGRPLPGRLNIVVTRNPGFRAPGCEVASSLDAALDRARAAGAQDEVFVIGGAQLYTEALPRAARLYLTRIDADIGGDIRFPAIHPGDWTVLTSEFHPPDEKNVLGLWFEVLARK